jgi:hypothetical protein
VAALRRARRARAARDGDPITKTSFGALPYELGIVELDRLVVFQKQINVAYVSQLRQLLGSSPTDEDVFRFALPFDRRYDPPIQYGQIAPNAWSFASPSADFRPLEPILLDPGQVTGLKTGGAPVAIVALVVGYGSNYLSAINVENRLVLNNGSHRAYALREAGIKHAPCLIRNVSRRDELELTGSEDLCANPGRYLDVARPPVLRDYFDEQLRLAVHVPRRNTQVRVGINWEKSLGLGA